MVWDGLEFRSVRGFFGNNLKNPKFLTLDHGNTLNNFVTPDHEN
jgi:hypothetical protein